MNSQDDRGWPDVERRVEERREVGPPDHVVVDGLTNGVKKMAWWGLTMLTTGVIAAIGWGVRTTIRDARQDAAIEQNQTANRVIDRALSDGLRSLSRTDSAFITKLEEDEEERALLLQRIIWIEAALDNDGRRP